jgi:hypothetical protein
VLSLAAGHDALDELARRWRGAGADANLLVQHKDEDPVLAALVVLLQQLHEPLAACVLVDHLDGLRHAVARRELPATNCHLHGVHEELHRKLLDRGRPRGGEHERLAVRADGRDDLADLGLEAEVEHAVRLVKHEVRRLLRACQAVMKSSCGALCR